MKSALDSEGFSRYDFNLDGKFAINYAVEYTVTLFNAVFEKNKKIAENLQDLIYVKCFLTSDLSRVAFIESETGHSLWSLIAVYSDIAYSPTTGITPNVGHNSRYLSNVDYIKSYYSANLMTKEQVNLNRLNPFKQGNEIIDFNTELSQDAYSNWANYGTVYTYPLGVTLKPKEIQLYPPSTNASEVIALEYLKTPTLVTALTDNIEFPAILTNLLTEKALFWISLKQGGAAYREGLPILSKITSADINNLTNLF